MVQDANRISNIAGQTPNPPYQKKKGRSKKKKTPFNIGSRKVAPRTANPYPAKDFFSSLTIVSTPPTGTPAAGPIQHDAQSFLQARSSQDASEWAKKGRPPAAGSCGPCPLQLALGCCSWLFSSRFEWKPPGGERQRVRGSCRKAGDVVSASARSPATEFTSAVSCQWGLRRTMDHGVSILRIHTGGFETSGKFGFCTFADLTKLTRALPNNLMVQFACSLGAAQHRMLAPFFSAVSLFRDVSSA
ncbi:hypothetical protein CTAM01_11139 [Colletotrichum tamarilloi]|uniref:Uncharacterized protein n=1 Tax=Colletotrichum tamarilloi TaxID=1209934 RepID=A0ABQ9QYF8_9PEZI|nr:uncharacterized protein CTAM01_11139 [Colletotrichum tamarilloi]KAK1489184.1 hypothetical protein CTAM01_11139 [Colletotrichum tamarilloi]